MAEIISEKIDLSTVKLIIWDLDDTFWEGTLSDNNANIILKKENIDLIETLTDCGILNSICSKNDYSQTKNYFLNNNIDRIWDYFVFPSINWEQKGHRIKNLISDFQLREENVLFLDDNNMNLQEAKCCCPKIQIASPEIISDIIEQSYKLEKKDTEHSRLKRYKILETKSKQRKKFNSNEKFLYSSNIKVCINSDCIEHLSRIHELIQRTNQLNYTKNRISESEASDLLKNPDLENRYVTVSDKYGNYGICGFYSFDRTNNTLRHFLFSCSVIGMGVEQYIYSRLNFPYIQITGDVSVKLNNNQTSKWINHETKNESKNKQKKFSTKYTILLKGPCDIGGLYKNFLNADSEKTTGCKFDIDTGNNDKNCLTNTHAFRLINIINAKKLSDSTKELILNDAGFITHDLYKQPIFNKEYDVIICSLIQDSASTLYRHNTTGEIVAWGSYPDFTSPKNNSYYEDFNERGNAKYIWNKDKLEEYRQKFSYAGYMNAEQIIENLDYLIESIPKTTKWIFILGTDYKPLRPDILTQELIFNRRKKQNLIIKKYLKTKKNASFVEFSNAITSDEDYTDYIDHYKAIVYYRLSLLIGKKLNKILNNKVFKECSILTLFSQIFRRKLNRIFNIVYKKLKNYNKIAKLIYMIYNLTTI